MKIVLQKSQFIINLVLRTDYLKIKTLYLNLSLVNIVCFNCYIKDGN